MRNNALTLMGSGLLIALMMVACDPQLTEPDATQAPKATLPVIRFGNETTPSSRFLSQNIPFPVQAEVNVPVNTTAIEQLLTQLLTNQTANVDALRPSAGAEPRYVAVGGGLTAGYRDGGLYRAGQLTSYPNLIAQQMGLRGFKQPLFSVEQGNGTGYKQWVAGTDLPRYVEVTNNRAIVSTDPLTLAPYTGTVSNLGMPYLGEHSIRKTDIWRVNSNLSPGSFEPAFYSYFRRLLPYTDDRQWTTFYYDVLNKQSADLCTIELGFDDLTAYAATGGQALVARSLGDITGKAIRAVLLDMQAKGTKCVITTVPDIRQFPYVKLYTVSDARQRAGGKDIYVAGPFFGSNLSTGGPIPAEGVVGQVTDRDVLIPSSRIEELFYSTKTDRVGLNKTNPLLNQDVLSSSEVEGLEYYAAYNQIIKYSANEFKTPVVDIAALYERILSGGYVTEDGININPAFPAGNFFSQDGLYPTALGQAVIANEWIKVINQAYKTNIPLVPTKQFVLIK